MTRFAGVAASLLVVSFCLSVLSADPVANRDELKFLEAFVGNWKVVTKEGDKEISVGEESSEWMLDKKFMRHVGWGQHEGEHVRYAFCSGWDPTKKKAFQWGFGGNASEYGIIHRVGTYDGSAKVWTNQASLILSDGSERTSRVAISFVNDDKITIDFTDRSLEGKDLPDHHDTFLRDVEVAKPDFDDAHGPGYRHLQFCDYYAGNWKVEGTFPDGTNYVGEEVNRWVMNRNFMHTEGWGRKGKEKRVEYELMVGWDPVDKKVTMWSVASDGALGIRKGVYESANKRVVSKQTGLNADGKKTLASTLEKFVDNDSFVLEFTNQLEGGEPQPNLTLKFTRVGQ